jgi:hypothetical protein
MDTSRLPLIARACVLTAGGIIVVCVAILLADYVVARVLTPRDDQRQAALQVKVKTDATFAPKLAADQKAVTERRLARKTRDNVLAYVLIVSAALFLSCAAWLLGRRGRQPVAMSRLVPVKPRAASPARTSSAARPAAPPGAPVVDWRFVDEIVTKQGRGKEAAIPILQAIQAHYRSLPFEALARVCELTEITPAQIEGAASLYARFRLPSRPAPRPRPPQGDSA